MYNAYTNIKALMHKNKKNNKGFPQLCFFIESKYTTYGF
jgi:hypothetical protein